MQTFRKFQAKTASDRKYLCLWKSLPGLLQINFQGFYHLFWSDVHIQIQSPTQTRRLRHLHALNSCREADIPLVIAR